MKLLFASILQRMTRWMPHGIRARVDLYKIKVTPVVIAIVLLSGCRFLQPDGEPHAPGRVDRDTFGVLTNSVTK